MHPRTNSMMAVTVVVMDAIIFWRRWRACVGGATLCLDGSGVGVRGRQRPRRLAVTAVHVRGKWAAAVV